MSDHCCPSCRGPLGICRSRTCWHHLEYQATEDKDGRDLQLHRDPTARDAIRNLGQRNG